MASAALRKGYLVLGGVGLYAVGVMTAYSGYRLYRLEAPPPGIADPQHQHELLHSLQHQERVKQPQGVGDGGACTLGHPSPGEQQRQQPGTGNPFDPLAATYDADVGWEEFFLRMNAKRRTLCRQAEGRVLEVSCGTGRNLPFYDAGRVTSLTLLDSSRPMLQRAWDKWHVEMGHQPAGSSEGQGQESATADLQPAFQVASTQAIPYQAGTFDVVVDSFGLCSCEDPLLALQEMRRVVREDGLVLLLEHGRSSRWGVLDAILDKTALRHAQTWGCWYNRDMVGLLEQSGLEVLSCKRYHFGTTYAVVARPAAPAS